jgi:hypothetical protein
MHSGPGKVAEIRRGAFRLQSYREAAVSFFFFPDRCRLPSQFIDHFYFVFTVANILK